RNRALLGLALEWSTTDPVANAPDGQRTATVDAVQIELGTKLTGLVNQLRLKGLPGRPGSAGPGFGAGGGTTDQLIVGLGRLAFAIEDRSGEQYAATVKNDVSGFADYKKTLAVLQRVNSTIEKYLDIDVTIKASDVNEIAKAIKQLQ